MKINVSNKFLEENQFDREYHIKNNGITLISLVITIIVLLILVGVSASMLIGSNSILDKAEVAVEVTNNNTIKEDVELAIFEKIAEYYSDYDDKIQMYPTAIDYAKSQFLEEKNYITNRWSPINI